MAYEIYMPHIGWERIRLLKWLKQDGDQILRGDLVVMVGNDDRTRNIEVFETGTLKIHPAAPEPGMGLTDGVLLGYVVPENEIGVFQVPLSESDEIMAQISSSLEIVESDQANTGPEPKRRRAISPRARRIAHELGFVWEDVEGTGKSGRIVERDIRAAFDGVAPKALPGSGNRSLTAGNSGNNLAFEPPAQTDREAPAIPNGGLDGDIRALPMNAIRQVIAERMSISAHTTTPVTLTTEVDATELVLLREKYVTEQWDPVPAYHDILMKLVADSLRGCPELNTALIEGNIVQHDLVNIGVTTDTERGLLVPVVHDVRSKSLQVIAEESAKLVEQTQAGTLPLDKLREGTFTITNLGMYDIDAFTPIINLPECAILGVGRIVPKVVVVDERTLTTGIRRIMALSLTFDHRLVDGGPAAKFLQTLKSLIEKTQEIL
ncbi:MAG: 2-oxo acid dehydrogenase subunit E2 [Candidatus Latescibacteria bacterium]|jgi:pyruvate dehydrogenase E2 component (dihydrolipoamide acetyltransferase)|nr:2-oxo acid dehydrogenase subunit E2 [Candidatus Latescibacterota bacterium]